MPNHSAQLNHVFYALSDSTRRAVVQRLAKGSAPVSELAKPFNMALPSFMQHLEVLEECGLVRSRKVGRVRIFQLTPKPLQLMESWLEKQQKMWNQRLDQLDNVLYELKGEDHDQ